MALILQPPPPLHFTVQTLSRVLLMTRGEASATGEVTKRNLNHRSCANASPLVPSCHCDGCADCHCGSDDVRGGGGWAVRDCRSTASERPDDDVKTRHVKVPSHGERLDLIGRTCSGGRWLAAVPSAPLLLFGPWPTPPGWSEECDRLRLERCRKRATKPRVT